MHKIKNYKIKSSKIDDIFLLYKLLRKEYQLTAILESLGEYDPNKSRYSIIGCIPKKILYGNRKNCILEDFCDGKKRNADWLRVLDDWTQYKKNDFMDSPLQIGTIGYIGYDEKYRFEELNSYIENDHTIPSIYLIKYALLFFLDTKDKCGYWVSDETITSDLIKKIEINYDRNFKNQKTEINKCSFALLGEIEADVNKTDYLKQIKKTIDYIYDGDIFQANITMRFHGAYSGDPFNLYEVLRINTPNPFFAYLDFKYPLISTSPERFIKIQGDHIFSNPIKGTVKCIIDGTDQKKFLLESEKNRAENVMIVDLIRNDIGRVCKQGSVEVLSLCNIQKFNSIYHLESNIKGTLKDNIQFSDILKATFPGGSITGAPKIRAMNIIEEIELKRRGPYTGLIGFFGERGWIDTSIAIRIIYFDDKKLYFHAGGGIVVESVAEDEYNELILKIESIKSSLEQFIHK